MITKKYPFVATFLISAFLIHLFLYGFYLLVSAGLPDKTVYLQLRRYIPCAVAAAAAISLWRKTGLPLQKLWPHAATALVWCITYPLCYWSSFHLNTVFIDNHYDQAFAAYLFAVTVCLRLLLYNFTDCPKKCNWGGTVTALLQELFLLVPITEIIYFYAFGRPISESACIAMLQTNPNEAKEFLLQGFGITGLASIVFFLILLFLLLAKGNRLTVPIDEPLSQSSGWLLPRKVLAGMLVLLIATGSYCAHIFHKTGVAERLYFAKQYFDESAKFSGFHSENLSHLEVIPPEKNFRKPSTVIMVIGESASRDFLSAYGYKQYDSTPWLRSVSSSPDFILYRHAYACWGNTVPVLERALTEKNLYNTMDFNQSFTVLDLAKKAGYITYWFSNQGTISDVDTPVTLVGKTADRSFWIEESLANTTEKKYDGDLLACLKDVDPAKNNFVVLHIMGSHDSFNNRYPPSFARWGDPEKHDSYAEYANSLAYTDQVLQEIHRYASEHLNLQSMLYFSDHGVIPGKLRDADISDFTAMRIPMFLYLSPEYRSLYPETASAFRSHAESYFTNDLIYETVAGLLNIKSNHYDPDNSLASPSYKWTRDTLKTNRGRCQLSEDVTEKRY